MSDRYRVIDDSFRRCPDCSKKMHSVAGTDDDGRMDLVSQCWDCGRMVREIPTITRQWVRDRLNKVRADQGVSL